ncbi:amidophosphoribosyltransferase [Roseovarius sp. SCSIO 43702]|nr:amidophosphoribosyltransferase [Roseovarius sp. SCSIO 43702]
MGAAATRRGALPTNALTLVGTFVKTRPEALIRHRSGQIEKVTLGDTVARQTVVAINDGLLVLMRNGKVSRLTMPTG